MSEPVSNPYEFEPVGNPDTLDEAAARPLLEQAQAIISGQRAIDYGSVTESFTKIAAIWTAILGTTVTPHDVALCMIGLKVARATNGYHFDSFLDIAGYAGCAELLNEEDK